MTAKERRWDPSQPGFVIAVLRMMIGLWFALGIGGALGCRQGFGGLVSGGLVAIALYLLAIQAGRAITQQKQYIQTFGALLAQQMIIWLLMAILLCVVKVHPVAFVVGASILPVAIILTLSWYALQNRRMPS